MKKNLELDYFESNTFPKIHIKNGGFIWDDLISPSTGTPFLLDVSSQTWATSPDVPTVGGWRMSSVLCLGALQPGKDGTTDLGFEVDLTGETAKFVR